MPLIFSDSNEVTDTLATYAYYTFYQLLRLVKFSSACQVERAQLPHYKNCYYINNAHLITCFTGTQRILCEIYTIDTDTYGTDSELDVGWQQNRAHLNRYWTILQHDASIV